MSGKSHIFTANSTVSAVVVNQQGTGKLFEVQDAGVPCVTVLDGGNVGIGESNPLAKLHVNGSMGIGAPYSTVTPPANGLIVSGNVGIGTTLPDAALAVSALNPVKVTQMVVGAEFPPAGGSNVGAYADYTDVVTSIDAGTPMTLVEYPPVGLTSADTTISQSITVSGAFYGNGTYVTSANARLDTNFPPWKAFNKILNGTVDDSWITLTGVFSSSTGYIVSGESTTVSGVVYTGARLQLQLPNSIQLKGYSISPRTIDQSPSDWIIAGSINGTTWVLLDTRTSEFNWIQGTFNYYTINNQNNYSYIRIIVTRKNRPYASSDYMAIAEWKLLADIPLPTTAREYPPLPMTANTSYLNGTYGAGSYVASASSTGASYPGYTAFNKVLGDTYNAWASDTLFYNSTGVYTGIFKTVDINNISYNGDWLQIQLPIAIILTSYSITSRSSAGAYTFTSPTKWYILASNDGTIWYIIDNQTQTSSVVWTAASQIKTYSINNSQNYKYYRIIVTNTNNTTTTSDVVIAEWKLFGTQATYPKYRTAIPSTSTTYNPGTYATYANTQYNATTVDAAPPLFVTDKSLANPWRTGASNYTISADASPTPSVFFELPAQIRLGSYRITAPDTSEAPSAWSVYGSNMNVAGGWLLLDTRTSVVTPWATTLTQTFSLASPTSAFNFFKVDLLRNCAAAPGDFISINELRLIGDDVVPESRLAIGADGRVAVNVPPSAVNTSAAMTVGGNLAINGSIRADNLGMFRNRIINGDMRIDQRFAGTSTTIAAASTSVYIADRWRVSNGTTSAALTMQRVRAPANPYGHVYALSAIATTAQATMNNQDYVTLEQRIEGYNIADFGWGTTYAQPITVSFAVYSTQAGHYSISLRNATNTMSYVAPFTVPVANQWVQVQQTVPGETMGTWEVETALGLSVAVTLAAGSNWVTSNVGRWQESSRAASGFGYAAATGGANFMGTVNNQLYLTGVQVERGTIATPFEARPFGVELVLCQRYYEKSYSVNVVPGTSGINAYKGAFNISANGGNGGYFATVRIAPKRITDYTVVFYDLAGNKDKVYANGNNVAGVTDAPYCGENSFGFSITLAGGVWYQIVFAWVINTEM